MKAPLKTAGTLGTILALLLVNPAAYAQCDSRSCTGLLKRLYMSDSRLLIGIDGDLKRLSCNAVSDVYIEAPLSHPAFDSWHSMLLGAMLSKRPVSIRIRKGERQGECLVGYIVLDRL
ncbi:MAG: hypothetical protein AAGG11_02085 [Pseudomonadota bacterium]